MKTKTITRTIADLVASREDTPLPLSVIPNFMGINLCSVESISWVEQEDGQLVSLSIQFLPETRTAHLTHRRRLLRHALGSLRHALGSQPSRQKPRKR
jgi:hypothetical protein